jgi:DNA-binding transcriptional ArsR family regulator
MIVMRFGPDALAHVRFAISPLTETMRSVAALDDPGAQVLHLPWVAEARDATRDLDLGLLRALQPPDVYAPDFTNPPPSSPLTEFEDELRVLTATPPARIADEVATAYRGRSLPAPLAPFVERPAEAVQDLAGLLRAYWHRTLARHWPRIRALLQGDVLHRARTLADGGAERLFADMDPAISWDGGALRLHKRAVADLELGAEGLLFVPSVFVWPRVVAVVDPAWQPTVVYPARGVGTLWEPGDPAAPDAIAALIGPGRAKVLAALDEPWSTTDLARRLGVSAGGVSRHLSVLRAAGLVHATRAGRTVLYMRSAAGDDVLDAGRTALRPR